MKDERAAEGLDHLQSAALELIKAARAFLDVAEDVVSDPDKVADALRAFGEITDVAVRAAKARGDHGADPRAGGDAEPSSRRRTPASAAKKPKDDGVQAIRVTG